MKVQDKDCESRRPVLFAVTEQQKKSIAELRKEKKYALYETVSQDNRHIYHNVSCRPITKKAEDDMELLSDIVTWGEEYLHFWEIGTYRCSRCSNPVYHSEDKYAGPCKICPTAYTFLIGDTYVCI